MSELQATLEFSVELYKFYNVDLFQRGMYQIRCALRVSPKLPVQIEVNVPETGRGLGSAMLVGSGGACRPFQILYRNEEVNLRDIIFFRAHMLVDSRRLKESLERAEFSIVLELWFNEQAPPPGFENPASVGQSTMSLVSTRTLQLHFSPVRGLHYHLPVLFDYFHLSAISITIHASLVALHQPYINTPRSAKPWLGTGKFSFRSPQPPIHSSLEAVFFGTSAGGTTAKCGGGGSGTAAKLAQARLLHQDVCSVLLEAYEALRAAFSECLLLLPQWQQIQLGQHGDASQRLRKLGEMAKLLDAEEDFAARANSDIAQLCAENIVQWQHFLAAVSCKAAIHQHLGKKHHSLRVKRFAEAFFVLDNPRHSAAGCYDQNYQNYLAVSELARRSRYLALLPPLPVHCVALDGDQTTIPIIFEDQYQDTLEFARRRSVAAGRKAGSDPILSAGISEPSLVSQEDCSCGITAILEARSNSRTGLVNVCEPKIFQHSNVVQASLTIAPNASGGRLHTSTLPARHSKSLDQLRVAPVVSSTLPRPVQLVQSNEPTHKHKNSRSSDFTVPDVIKHGSDYYAKKDAKSHHYSKPARQCVTAVARYGDSIVGKQQHRRQSEFAEGEKYQQRHLSDYDSDKQQRISDYQQRHHSDYDSDKQQIFGERLPRHLSDYDSDKQRDYQTRHHKYHSDYDSDKQQQRFGDYQQRYHSDYENDRLVRNGDCYKQQRRITVSDDKRAGKQSDFGEQDNSNNYRRSVIVGDFYPRSSINLSEYDNPNNQLIKSIDSNNFNDKSAVTTNNLTLPRPILPPRNSYPPRSLRQNVPSSSSTTKTSAHYASSSAPNPQIVHSAPTDKHIPRSNSTQIFPHTAHASDFDSLFPNNTLLQHPKHRHKLPRSTKDLTQIVASTVVVGHAAQNGDLQQQMRKRLPKSANNLLELNNIMYSEDSFYNKLPLPLPPRQFLTENIKSNTVLQQQKTSSCNVRYNNNNNNNNVMKTSADRVKQKQQRPPSDPTSSSTDSESLLASTYKRLETSASVPFHLGRTGESLRHARSAASVLDEAFLQPASTSESLPNLAPPLSAKKKKTIMTTMTTNLIKDGRSLSTSASTSSLTSEQSGWVSSRRSSEPSSPDIPVHLSRAPLRHTVGADQFDVLQQNNGPKIKQIENQKYNTMNGNGIYGYCGSRQSAAICGEKLREKLQKLAAENNLKNVSDNNSQQSKQKHENGIDCSKQKTVVVQSGNNQKQRTRRAAVNTTSNSSAGSNSSCSNNRNQLINDNDNLIANLSNISNLKNGDQKMSILGVTDNNIDIYNKKRQNSIASIYDNNSVPSTMTPRLHPYIRKECPVAAMASLPLPNSSSADGIVAVSESSDVMCDFKDDESSKTADEADILVDHPYEELRLPPPQQFRDVPPPPEPFRDPPSAPPLPIDNLLYHVYETVRSKERGKQANSEMTKSQSTSELAEKLASLKQHEESSSGGHRKMLIDEAEQAFLKSRDDFKRQINFSGTLYSDFATYASTLPYFHISDEYRMFSPEGLHLIICVHGLDGNSADLRLVKTYLELGLPGAHLEFLMSERNQGDTFSDFDTMTDRLVAEILYQIESCNLNPTRISFVGHSLGNIIIRSALTRPQMKPLLSRLHTFLSLSGPHLGTLYNSSGLVNMGMWFMQKWKKSGSLLQLCLRDAPDVRQTFLYRLSQRSTLHHFKNVLLCGSSQDRYVPLHSARLELCKAAVRDTSSLGSAYREMVHNVVAPMLARRELTLVRYDVHHALPHTANALIGRAAHIAVLDSELFIEKFLVVAGLKYFR